VAVAQGQIELLAVGEDDGRVLKHRLTAVDRRPRGHGAHLGQVGLVGLPQRVRPQDPERPAARVVPSDGLVLFDALLLVEPAEVLGRAGILTKRA
jgi:hypothetical protein